MRKGLSLTLCAFLMLAVFVVPLMAKEMKPVRLRASCVFPPPETSLAGKSLVIWEEMVTEATEGAITFKNYWGQTLGKPAEHLSLIQTGAVDVVLSYGWYTPTKLPLQDFDYVFPFGPIDPYIVCKACRELYEEFPCFRKNLEKYNCTRVFQVPGTTFVFLSKKPLKRLGDFEGLKCAVIGRYFGRWIGAIGAVPVAAPGQERYTMLQTGVVDASFNPVDLAYCFKDVEQAPYCLDPGLLVTNWISCWINLDTLKKFPPKIQALLLDLGRVAEVKQSTEVNLEWQKMVFEEWKKRKDFHYSKLPEEDKKEWASTCSDIPAEWAAEVTSMGYPGWEIVERYQEITAELGHEWIQRWGVKE